MRIKFWKCQEDTIPLLESYEKYLLLFYINFMDLGKFSPEKLPPGKFPPIKLLPGESPLENSSKIPTWNIPTYFIK